MRIVIVDDHQVVRSGLRSELAGSVHVVGEAGSVAEAVEVIARTEPDVVLLDVHLPDGSGADVIGRLGDRTDARFLAFSVSEDPADVIATVHAGARGYLTKSSETGELLAALTRVSGGDAVFAPRLAGFVLDAFQQTDAVASDADLASLTERELATLRVIARGLTYREAAEELVVSPRTVETHVSNVLRKLQLTDRRQLERWARERRLA
ncbi:response regulator transcription factor [Egibacter rhizosphaerae]|uniref:Response regulator transcription factor n=1 Tax=Egibacter rhizosphaerae TaxID=1670831 RepID=A0A411YD95_9ACTN|nr:response regulator transcription factor [Egibacter rhizosphaerae]QBI19170.1 response regulator transcription factor [Egibacter rhizosphaerae]